MRVIIENTEENISPGLRVVVERGHDDVDIHEVMNMIVSCLQGMGYHGKTIADGFSAWLEENGT